VPSNEWLSDATNVITSHPSDDSFGLVVVELKHCKTSVGRRIYLNSFDLD
jgi:hypothetical protein